jgi:uncharacterized integral membrane protein (TIGR00698 family)
MITKLPPFAQQVLFIVILALCLTPLITPPLALLLGLIVAQTIGHPFIHLNHKATQWLLKVSIVGLGFGMNLHHAIQAGKEGFIFTLFSISLTLVSGLLIGRWLKVDQKTSFLISCGTAICGGSAIAAISPIIKSNEKQISIALGIIFILNSVALFIFPMIGHWFNMSQHQFGLWSAVAIHDTSSVVGASAKYGKEALQIATTVKLERTLWIIPVSFFVAAVFKNKEKTIKIPYFIILFVLAMVFSTYLPNYQNIYAYIVTGAKSGLSLTLFLIGAGLNYATIKSVGKKPLFQGILIWILISIVAFLSIINQLA